MRSEPDLDRVTPKRMRLNWILTGMMALVLIFVCFVIPYWGSRGFAVCGAYAGLLMLGVWRVRPKPGRERLFPWIMLPIAIQAIVYLAVWVQFAVDFRTTWTLPVEVGDILLFSALILVAAGPFMLLPLVFFATRPSVLVVAEALGPILIFGVFGLP